LLISGSLRTASPYQRVGTTALDVTEAGKKELWYLAFDGVDDFLSAGIIDLSGTDKAFFSAAFSDDSAATSGLFSHNSASNPSLLCYTSAGGASHSFRYRGTTAIADATNIPTTNNEVMVASVNADASTPSIVSRKNGTNLAAVTTNPGLAAFSSTGSLYLGAVQGINYLKGPIFGAVFMANRTATTSELAQVDSILASRSGVELP